MIFIFLLLRFHYFRLVNSLFSVLEYIFWRYTCIMKWNIFFDISWIRNIRSNLHIFYQIKNSCCNLPSSHNPYSLPQIQRNREMWPFICLERLRGIITMRSSTNVKEVQKLICCFATLSHFLSYTGDKGFIFFIVLRKNVRFEWTASCKEVFTKVKKFLTSPPHPHSPEGRVTITPLSLSHRSGDKFMSIKTHYQKFE